MFTEERRDGYKGANYFNLERTQYDKFHEADPNLCGPLDMLETRNKRLSHLCDRVNVLYSVLLVIFNNPYLFSDTSIN